MNIEFCVGDGEGGVKLGAFLRRAGVSLRRVRSLKFTPHGLSVNGRRAFTGDVLAAGDVVSLALPAEERASAVPQRLRLEIVYEGRDAAVIEKPAGQLVHPGPGNREGTVANAFCGAAAARGWPCVFRPIGRLDGGTSGLLLCALHAASAPLLAKTREKSYLALACGGTPPQGEVDAPIAPRPDSRIAQAVCARGRPAFTRYVTLARGGGLSLVRVWTQTGRTHQIRVHFAHIGHPLLGDSLYGAAHAGISRHALHCAELGFTTLEGERVRLVSPLPPDMLAAARQCGIDPRESAILGGLAQNGQ